MRATWRAWIATTLLLVASGVVFERVITSSSRLSWATFHWPPLLLALAAAIAQELLNPLLAQYSLRAIGQDGGYWRLLGIVTTTSASNAAIPLPAGIPLRAWLQKQWLGLSYQDSAFAAILESLINYGVLGLVAILALSAWAPDLLHRSTQIQPWILLCSAFVVLAALGICVRFFIKRYATAIVAAIHSRRPSEISWKSLSMVAAIAALGIALAYARIALLGWAISIGALNWGLIFTGLVVSRLAGVASMIPMGLGARDISLGYFLVLAGATSGSATAWALLDRVVMTLPYLMFGLISAFILHRSKQAATTEKGDPTRDA